MDEYELNSATAMNPANKTQPDVMGLSAVMSAFFSSTAVDKNSNSIAKALGFDLSNGKNQSPITARSSPFTAYP